MKRLGLNSISACGDFDRDEFAVVGAVLGLENGGHAAAVDGLKKEEAAVENVAGLSLVRTR